MIALILPLASGCVSLPDATALQNRQAVNLNGTPFFPQEAYQCGPAALATLLGASGVAVTPEELIPKVYLPERKGSLQLEMVAAARSYGRIPYLIEPKLSHLLDELDAGRPVLVLQNLGFDAIPIWHYAVVIGYQPEQGKLLLRSGTDASKTLSVGKFIRTWGRAKSWAFVALRPDELPANIDKTRLLNSAIAMETLNDTALSIAIYENLIKRFPNEAFVWLGLANNYQRSQAYDKAIEAYYQVLRNRPDHIAATNNLALALSQVNCHDEAIKQAQKATQLATRAQQFVTESQHTLTEVKTAALSQKREGAAPCSHASRDWNPAQD